MYSIFNEINRMLTPDEYIEICKRYTYKQLIYERDDLIGYIQDFEDRELANPLPREEMYVDTEPVFEYQMYKEYLARLLMYMQELYDKDYVCANRTLYQTK